MVKKITACLIVILMVLPAACFNKDTPDDSIIDESIQQSEWLDDFLLRINPPRQETATVTSTARTNPVIPVKGVEASSELADSRGRYSAANLIDYSWESWAEGSNGSGIGESFTIILEGEQNVAGFALKNGYGHLDYYNQNNRVKSFSVYADGNYIETILIKDSISFEQYTFASPVSCETIRFVIDDIYPGTRYNDTCVAEIVLLNRIVEDNQFYERILVWLGDKENYMRDTQYENHNREIASVSDPDKLMLLDYLPFDVSVDRITYKTKIALLDYPSLLKLNENLPRLDGATAMYPLYSAFVHAVYPEMPVSIRRTFFESLSTWAYFPNNRIFYEMYYYTNENFNSIVQCNTTSKAYERLINGETEIIFCYEPSLAEINAAADKGLAFNLTPIAKDAFVFIVNEKNTVSNITQQQIRDIYTGRVSNWMNISGDNEPIIAYQRPLNSGSQTILQSIMGDVPLMRPILDGEGVRDGMFYMILTVASNYYNYNSAIGYSFLFYLTQMAGDSGIKILSVDGISPTRQNIHDNMYPFTQTVYAVTIGNESDNTKKFIEWMLSSQGQELAEKTGYISVNY